MLPDVPTEEWDQYQSDVFRNDTDQRIASLPLHVAPIRDDWMQPGAFAPTPSSDSLTNPLGAGNAPVPEPQPAPEAIPTPDVPVPPPVVSSGYPAPDAPLPTDFGTHADTRIASLSPPASPASASSPPAGQATSSTVNGVSGPPDLVAAAMNAADAVGVDPNLYVSVIQQESSFKPTAGSPAGAQGLAQLMPATARGLGVTDPWDPIQSLQGGARYLKQQLDTFGGDVVKALAAYNAGPGAVQKYGGIPPYEETQRYVKQVMGRLSDEPIDTSQITGIPGTYAPGPAEGLTRVGSGVDHPHGASGDHPFGPPPVDNGHGGTGQMYQTPTGDWNIAFGFNQPYGAAQFNQNIPNHRGVDLTIPGAQNNGRGTPYRAFQPGTVVALTHDPAGGNGIIVQTADGLYNRYFHNDKVLVGVGDKVDQTTQIGVLGASGTEGFPHLHFEVSRGINGDPTNQLIDPRPYMVSGDSQGGDTQATGAVPATSAAPVADQQEDPLAWLARQKDSLAAGIGGAASSLGNTVSGAASSLFGPQPAGQPAASQPMPSDALTNPLGTGNAPQPPASSMTPLQPQQSVWDRVGQGISDVFRSAFGRVNLTDPTQSVIGGNPIPPATMPTSTQLIQHAEEQKNQFIAENNPLRDVPVVGGLTTGVAQAIDPLLYAAGPILGTAARALPIGEGLAGSLARGAFQGAGYGAIQGATQPEADVGSTVRGAAIGAGLGLAGEGGVAALERFKPPEVARAATGPPSPATPTGAYQSVMPSGTFVTPTPPTPSAPLSSQVADVRDTVFRNLTRAFTDRQVDINQAQQRYAQALGRPLQADEMAAELQRLTADPAAAVKIDEGLKPAIQAVGDDYAALRDYVTLRSNVQVADALGNDARLFSGGMTKADSQTALANLQAQLGPDRFQTVQQAADQVSQFSVGLRQRLVDSGVLSQDQANAMEAKYPDWVKTRILDYMKDPTGGQGAGTKIGLSSRDVQAYTQAGTARAREDPLASTVAYTHQAERMANKNEAFNAMLKIDQASPKPMLRQVPQDFSPTRNQVTMVGFQNGQKVKYVTDNKALGEAINGAGVMSVPEWTSAWQKVFRSLATSRNPVFLAGNAALDIPTYTFRTAIRDGGPQALPGIMADLARGYGDAFQGILQGEYRGAGTSAFLKGGGGQSGYFTGGEGQTGQAIADLRRSNVFQIDGKADLLRLAKDLVTLKPVEALGERIELGPRVAAYNRALARGANPVQAVIDGRTVTVDFSQGGTVTKYLNNFVPFANVGAQGPVQLARAFRDNPRAFVATTGSLIGLPTVAAEVWNRADPQRAKDYADVPENVKNQGVVVMLPGEAPTDAQGNRKPLYAVLKLREWAPFAAIAREATARALGDNSKSLAEMAQSIGTGLSPTQSSSAGQLANEALSGIPVVPAAAQLGVNKDLFRNRDIVTQRNDQNASAAAKALTPAIQAVLDRAGVNAEVRPSAVEFFIRNQGAGVGGAALGASDIAAGTARQNTSPTSLPGVGGLVGRFVSDQTGQGLQTARGEILTQSARDILRQNGITSTPGAVGSSANGVPLRLEEETRYQQLANRYVDEAIHRAPANPNWTRMPQSGKQALVDELTSAAKERAAQEVLRSIGGPSEARRRVAVGNSR